MYEHELSITENEVNINDLPRSLKAKINRFKQLATDFEKMPAEDPKKSKKQIEVEAYSAAIADEIQDWVEKDLEEAKEEEEQQVEETTETVIEPDPVIIDTPPAVNNSVTETTPTPRKKSIISSILGGS